MNLWRWCRQSFRTDGESWQTNPDACKERRIRKNLHAEEVDEHRRMTEPGECDLCIAPRCRLGLGKDRSHRPPAFNRPFAKKMAEPAPDAGAAQSWLLRCFHRRSQTALRNFSEPESVLPSGK